MIAERGDRRQEKRAASVDFREMRGLSFVETSALLAPPKHASVRLCSRELQEGMDRSLVKKATTEDEDPTPGYVFNEITSA